MDGLKDYYMAVDISPKPTYKETEFIKENPFGIIKHLKDFHIFIEEK